MSKCFVDTTDIRLIIYDRFNLMGNILDSAMKSMSENMERTLPSMR